MTSPSLERLLVVAPNWLGDAVMALPALADVRRRFPAARLIVAARPAVADLFSMSPIVDDVLVIEWTGRLMAASSRRRDLARLREARADAALLLPNSFASAWLVTRAGVPERWGYAADLRGPLLSRAIARPALRRHQSEYYRHLVRELSMPNAQSSMLKAQGAMPKAQGPMPNAGFDTPVVVPGKAIEQAQSLLRSHGWDGTRPLVVIAPGAAYGAAKRWPSDHFARTVTTLVREQGAHCALVGSTADAGATREVRSLVPDSARPYASDLAGTTTLETLAAVLSLARACVSNDSGTMHLAGAVGVPLAALFGPTRERETMPLSRPGRRVEILINHVWCRPCMLRECPLDHRCMTGLAPERVLATVRDLIGAPSPESRAPSPESPVPSPEP